MLVPSAALLLLLAVAGCAVAQDPAEGWLGYAKGVNPSGEGIITYIEAKWRVGSNPRRGGAFFSPWFGIETSDNLNLIQPVNPWTGNQWQIYNEYFQWVPTHNYNSEAHVVRPGDVLFGSVSYNPSKNSYTVFHKDMNDGWSVTTEIPVQRSGGDYKKYTIVYFVFEKEWDCDQYPPDGEVTFYDIKVQYNNQTVSPQWTTAYVDDVCNNRAHIVDESTIKITWDTTN
ncbi:hypothetical protein PTSG_04950 [Salpingoeca rosetta]|uniref:Uncharacterized protein n=1 Tax=Salpingoeca rosetta (strain ATCC 50818 / BSB-021) TaxID=946362 RepID=F2U931_SALR5|nr:uncharacterized protein PTSG_04950 [Salpingoeca rosetta]EGD73234.1 hypothetical protein PTSG_04950 [Salpingoeca rosetta]|eukprot:XP_004994265.1 hypothetical protein PTSG_04950 [Salpingoeca rosetta]